MTGPKDFVGQERADGERLAHDPVLGTLLRRANVEYRAGLDESDAYRRVSEQLEADASRPRPRAHVVTALGLACAAAAGWLVWIEVGRGTSPELLLGPEVSVGETLKVPGDDAPAPPRSMSPERDNDAPPEAAQEGPMRPLAEREAGEPGREAERAPRAALSREALEPRPAEAGRNAPDAAERAQPEGLESSVPRRGHRGEPLRQTTERERGVSDRSLDEPPRRSHRGVADEARGAQARISGPGARAGSQELGPAREDCLAFARQGQPRAAEQCFDQRAAGSGLGAEMALYEMARLRRDVLSDAVGALAALSAYRERFARGSLRNEVDLSRVELLAELGRSADALRESATLLGSSSGRERAAELHQLRADVYRRQLGDLRAAAAEYAQVEALGGARGADASRSLGACFEGLGDIPGALAAYRRYVRDPGRPHVAEVRRRIERLSGTTAGGR